jgi:hypothetical protein
MSSQVTDTAVLTRPRMIPFADEIEELLVQAREMERAQLWRAVVMPRAGELTSIPMNEEE